MSCISLTILYTNILISNIRGRTSQIDSLFITENILKEYVLCWEVLTGILLNGLTIKGIINHLCCMSSGASGIKIGNGNIIIKTEFICYSIYTKRPIKLTVSKNIKDYSCGLSVSKLVFWTKCTITITTHNAMIIRSININACPMTYRYIIKYIY